MVHAGNRPPTRGADSPTAGTPPGRPAPAPCADQLESLLGQLAAILQPSPPGGQNSHPCDLGALRADLATVIVLGAQQLASRLRGEMPCWTAAIEDLQRLAACRYLPLLDHVAALRDELMRAGRHAQQVADALETLGEGHSTLPEAPTLRIYPGTAHPGLPAVPTYAGPAFASQETVHDAPLYPVAVASIPEAESENPPAPPTPSEPSAADLALLAEAEQAFRSRDAQRALALYTDVLDRLPRHRAALVRRGQAFLLCNRPGRAIVDFTAALRLDDDDAEAHLYRGDCHVVLGRIDEAVTDYSRCLDLDPGRTRARFNRAVCYRLRGQHSLAVAELTALLEVEPDNESAFYNRGRAHAAQQAFDEAASDFLKALEINPSHPHAREKLREVRKAQRALATPVSAPPATAAPIPGTLATPSPAPAALPAVVAPRAAVSMAKAPTEAPNAPAATQVGAAAPRAATPGEGKAIRIQCPACQAAGAIPWDKLARLHVCRGCGRSFRVDPKGGLVEVVKSADGKWCDRKVHESTSQRARFRRLMMRRLLPGAALAATLLLAVWWITAPAASSEVELPRELEPRVELFTQGWIHKDWQRARLLVTPGEEKNLYRWTVRHPPPQIPPAADELTARVNVEVIVLSRTDQRATVKVRIHGATTTADLATPEYTQTWEERAGTWYLVVPKR